MLHLPLTFAGGFLVQRRGSACAAASTSPPSFPVLACSHVRMYVLGSSVGIVQPLLLLCYRLPRERMHTAQAYGMCVSTT